MDLRGLTVAEALLEVDQALEEARALGLSTLRLLHGKGTGALRQAIREALRRDKRVESFADAPPGEGAWGYRGGASALRAWTTSSGSSVRRKSWRSSGPTAFWSRRKASQRTSPSQ